MRAALLGSVAGVLLTIAGTVTVGAAENADAARFETMNPRTSFTRIDLVSGTTAETPNATQARPALSIAKLYLVDHVIGSGTVSDDDRELCRRAIELSDDAAADSLDSAYPEAIDATAAAYRLTDTARGSFWGDAQTSAHDATTFLAAKLRTDPRSPVLGWMASASPTAADGTVQNWGTAHLSGVQGSKWGWSDDGVSMVASASYGPGFAAAAFTDGDPAAEDADLGPFEQ